MVDVATTQQQINEARQQLEAQRQQVQSFNPQIQLTRMQLMQQTPTTAVRVAEAQRIREMAKTQAMQEIQSQQQQIDTAQQQVNAYNQNLADYNAGVNAAIQGQPVRLETVSDSFKQGFMAGSEQEASGRALSRAEATIKSSTLDAVKANQEAGYTPVDASGKTISPSLSNINKIQALKTPEGRQIKLENWNSYLDSLPKTEIKPAENLAPSTGFSMVSGKDLITQNVSGKNGLGLLGGGSSGLDTGIRDGNASQLQHRDSSGNWLTNIVSSFKKGQEEFKEKGFQQATGAEVHAPTTSERVVGAFNKAGVNLPPSLTSAYNELFRGAERGSYQALQPVSALDIVSTPITAVGQLSGIAAGATLAGLKKLDYPSTYTIPEQRIPQRVTMGGEFVIPTQKANTIYSPETISTAVGIGTGIGLAAGLPLALVGIGTTASGVSKFTTPKEFVPEDKLNYYLGAGLELGTGLLLTKMWAGTPTFKAGEVPVTRNLAQDTIEPITIGDKQFDIVNFRMQSSTPPRMGYFNTKLGKLFFRDEAIPISEPRVDITQPLKKFAVQDGQIVGNALINRFKQGANYGYISKLEGAQKVLEPELFSPSNKVQNFLVNKLSEARGTSPKVTLLKTDDILSLGNLKSTEIMKVNPSTKTVTWFGRAGKLTRALSASEAESIIKTPEVEIFRTSTVLKDTTNPNFRLTGKTPLIEGESAVFKPKDITPPEDISLSSGKGTKSVQEASTKTMNVLESIKAPEALKATKAAARANYAAASKFNKLMSEVTSDTLPKIVGGAGLSQSQYAGTGQYQLTNVKTFSAPKLNAGELQKSFVNERLGTETIASPKEALKFIQTPIESTIQQDKQVMKEFLALGVPQAQKIAQKQSIKEVVSPRAIPATQPQLPVPPRIPPRPIPFRLPRPQQEKKRIIKPFGRTRADTFTIFTRRYGKLRPVASGSDISTVVSAGKRVALSTLGQSLYLYKGATPIKLAPDRAFRASKNVKNPFAIVQRSGREGLKGGKLSSYDERREIQILRKAKAPKFKMKRIKL